MQKRHINRHQYFLEQGKSTAKYVLPYIFNGLEQRHPCATGKECRVLEIGCGEGGNLSPFLEAGCTCWGVELSQTSLRNARSFYAGHPLLPNVHFVHKDIYDVTPEEVGGVFDIVFLKDVIEHIPDQARLMHHLKRFVSPTGVLFISFPPWRMPFGGHQQVCSNKWISRMPYIHLFPKPVYRAILRMFGLPDAEVKGLLDIADTGISIGRFKKCVRQEKYEVIKKTNWLVNPNYEVKFGLKPRRVPIFFKIPYIHDFYTTAVYYLLKQGAHAELS